MAARNFIIQFFVLVLRYPLNLIPFYRHFEQNIFLCSGPTNASDVFVSHLNMFVFMNEFSFLLCEIASFEYVLILFLF